MRSKYFATYPHTTPILQTRRNEDSTWDTYNLRPPTLDVTFNETKSLFHLRRLIYNDKKQINKDKNSPPPPILSIFLMVTVNYFCRLKQ